MVLLIALLKGVNILFYLIKIFQTQFVELSKTYGKFLKPDRRALEYDTDRQDGPCLSQYSTFKNIYKMPLKCELG
jgi:hypothetical protein